MRSVITSNNSSKNCLSRRNNNNDTTGTREDGPLVLAITLLQQGQWI
jgi:hypothetical protein